MSDEIRIPTRYLSAALRFVARRGSWIISSKSHAYSLRAVLVERDAAGGCYVVATNKHFLFAGRWTDGTPVTNKKVQVVIPAGIAGDIDAIINSAAHTIPLDDVQVLTLAAGKTSLDGLAFTPYEYFPDWRRVVPASVSGKPSQVSFPYLTEFNLAAQILTGDDKAYPFVCHNGPEGAALIGFPAAADCLGVVMPIKMSASTGEQAIKMAAEIGTPPPDLKVV